MHYQKYSLVSINIFQWGLGNTLNKAKNIYKEQNEYKQEDLFL